MLEELNRKLVEAKARLRDKHRFENMLLNTQEKLQEEKRRLKELSENLAREEYDVKKLEALSITSLFYQILGTVEQKLDKERQEFLAAKLKYDSSKNMISALEYEILSLEANIKNLGDPQSDYLKLLKEKERILEKSEDEKYSRLIERVSDLESDRKELKEAVSAGNQVLSELEKVISSLKSAGNWGIFDLIGGGIIATAVKHSKIDDAKKAVDQVQHLLHKFHQELSDVQLNPESDLGIEIGSFQKFADYFFDGLIFDWVVQSKINQSLKNSEKIREDVVRIISRLQNELERVLSEKEKVESEKEDYQLI